MTKKYIIGIDPGLEHKDGTTGLGVCILEQTDEKDYDFEYNKGCYNIILLKPIKIKGTDYAKISSQLLKELKKHCQYEDVLAICIEKQFMVVMKNRLIGNVKMNAFQNTMVGFFSAIRCSL